MKISVSSVAPFLRVNTDASAASAANNHDRPADS